MSQESKSKGKSKKSSKPIWIALVLAIGVLSYYLFWYLPDQSGTSSDQAVTVQQPATTKNSAPDSRSSDETTTIEDRLPQTLENSDALSSDLILIGTVVGKSEQSSSATIKSRMQVRTYFIGDQIAYSNAILQQIHRDHVVLAVDGGNQLVRVEKSPGDTARKGRQGLSNSAQTSPSGKERPLQIEHFVTLSPYYSGSGFLVSPGIDPQLFRTVQFQSGDVLQKVNGLDISTDEGLLAVQAMIPQADKLVFSVMRAGEVISLLIELPLQQ